MRWTLTLAGIARAMFCAAAIVSLFGGAAWARHGGPDWAGNSWGARGPNARILVQGAPLVGGANGMFFDADNNLYVANANGQTVSLIDPETGEILDQLGSDEGVVVPDDVTVGADGSLFWTDPALGTVIRRPPIGPSFNLLPFFSFRAANPLTLSDDGRLFFAQCGRVSSGIFEVDPNAFSNFVMRRIRDGDPTCYNGMDWWDGALYTPRVFEGRIVKVDIDTGALTDVTTGWGVPIAVKFNSQGELHAVNDGNGEVVRIDLDTGDRTVLAQLPVGWLDNLAFDDNDRLFISSNNDAAVLEVMSDGSLRTVSPGGLKVPMGLAILGHTVYTGHPSALRGFDTWSGDEVSVTRSVFRLDPLPRITSVAAWNSHVILMSSSGDLVVWDPETASPVLETTFGSPLDAQPFQGDLIVSEAATGNVVRASGPDLSVREILATTTMAGGLAATEDDLYVSDSGTGEVLQVVEDGQVLDPPKVVASGFELPEGIALRSAGENLLVVDGGAEILVEVDLKSGNVRTIATDLGFQKPTFNRSLSWFNDVDVDSTGAMYVNADRANVIYTPEPPSLLSLLFGVPFVALLARARRGRDRSKVGPPSKAAM